MEWNNEEQNIKKGMSMSSKVLLGIIACILLIIVLLIMLLMNTKEISWKMYKDGQEISSVSYDVLMKKIENVTYVNINEFTKIVGYEFHKGEYKSSVIEEDKCYVEGADETTSFYLNDNKIYKLPSNKLSEEYTVYDTTNTVKELNDIMYASTETISKAFNVLITEANNEIQIYTLDYLVNACNTDVVNLGYTDITGQTFENKKSILYGYIIVKKEGGLYKIIDANTKEEKVLDRYTSIQFCEETQEFFVTDSSNRMGILALDGTTKIEPTYASISLLSKEHNLYIVELEKKYGVISGDGRTIIYPEYDSIGISNTNVSGNKYLLLNQLIPVCREKKYGAFNVNGELVLDVQYDEFGYNLTSIQIDGVKELVKPVLTIKRANAIVVKKDNKYGLIDVKGKSLVKIVVDGIYLKDGVEEENYFMLYNGEEMNVIERLIEAKLIEKENDNESDSDQESENNMIDINNITTENTTESENLVSNEM